MEKLDPQLRILLQERTPVAGTRGAELQATARSPQARATRAAARETEEPARVIVEFRGDLADLEAIGFVKHSLVAHPTKGYKIATGVIPIESLQSLAGIDHVVVVNAPSPLRPLLNYSANEIGALAVHTKSPGGATGKGVVIGMIDSGLEVRHGDFNDDDFKSRIIAVWDQKTTKTDGSGGVNGLGRIYSRNDIQTALAAKKKLGTEDKVGPRVRSQRGKSGASTILFQCYVEISWVLPGASPGARASLRSGTSAKGKSTRYGRSSIRLKRSSAT
jgi:hypothetical protein